jgi:hypothetical protein
MSIGTVSSRMVLSLFLATAIGCSGQPTAPSPSDSAASDGSSSNPAALARFGDRMPGTIYVTSQGLYYDTFVVKDPLPMQGRFQQLMNGQTEFGPGQPGYLGGRWWEDSNGDGVQDPGDHYFLCPLLPPGRPTP